MSAHILADGTPTVSDDPLRLVWYSATCSRWTDDFDTLSRRGGIPVCPSCGSPGYQCTAGEWDSSAAAFQDNNNAGYVVFINGLKNVCRGHGKAAGRLWDAEKDAEKVTVRVANTPAEIFRHSMEPLPNAVSIGGYGDHLRLSLSDSRGYAVLTPAGARELARVLCECADRIEVGKPSK